MNSRRLFSITLFIAIFTMAVRPTLDPDMWWHLRTGQVILEDGLPRSDIYSFTVPDHQWTTHEWLSELFMWSIYKLAGLPGLILIFAGLITMTFWLVYRISPGKPYSAGFVILLAALATAPFWGVRPQVFNMLFTAAFLHQLERWRGGNARALWLLPALTLVWANLHSGYLLGIAILAVYLVGSVADKLWPQPWAVWDDRRSLRHLALALVVSFLAAVVNPNGPGLWIYPFFTLDSQAMQSYIQEWQSPDFHQAIFLPFALLLAVGIAVWILSRRRPTWSQLLLFGGTAGAGLLSSRHIPIFALVASPFIAMALYSLLQGGHLDPLLDTRPGLDPPAKFLIVNWLVLLLMLTAAALWSAGQVAKNDEEIAGRFPVQAVEFLERNGIAQNRGFNSYNWGGYLIWRDVPVFVDGRADVYGDEFLHYYRRTFDLTEKWQEPLDDFDVTYVLIEDYHPLKVLLESNDQWEPAYRDDLAVIFTRVVS